MHLTRVIRYLASIILLCLLVPLLASCWDRTEIEQLSIILAAGLDQDGEWGDKDDITGICP